MLLVFSGRVTWPPIAQTARSQPRSRLRFLLCQTGCERGAADRDRTAAWGGAHEGENAADEEAFQRAERFLVGLAVGFATGEVLARGCVDAGLGDGDDVDGVVELAVAGAVEPVALLFAEEASSGAMPA